MRSSMPPVPFGISVKSSRPAAFCGAQKQQWSVAVVCSCPEASPAHSASLMMPGAERRAHHVRGRHGPVRVAIDALVDHQMLRQHFAEHALARWRGRGRWRPPPPRSRHARCRSARRAARRWRWRGSPPRPPPPGGRDSACASGPVMPASPAASCCRWNTASPFSACTVQIAPSSSARREAVAAARRRPTMIAPL